MFHIRRDRIVAEPLRYSGILFECALENKVSRKATILSQEYELWFMKNEQDSSPEFVTRLSFDLFSLQDKPTFEPNSGRGIKLIWHFTESQLQRIEDLRQGSEPWFQIRSRLTIYAQWLKTDGTPHAGPDFSEESASDSHAPGHYPVRF